MVSEKYYEFNLIMNKISSDSGFLFEDWSYENSLSFGAQSYDLYNDENVLLIINIFSSDIQTTYTRKYIKVQSIAANVGGIVNFLVVISEGQF